MSPLRESCAAGVDAREMPAAGGAAQPARCRARLSLKLFSLLAPSVDAHLPLGSRASLPAQQPSPCPGHRRPSQTGGLWLRGAAAGAGGTKVFLLVVVMEMMLPAAAAGSLQRR